MKKTVLSLIFISLLVLPSCKKVAENYIIAGTWELEFRSDDETYTEQYIFAGSETTGTVTDGYSTGTYTVLDNSVTFSVSGWSNTLNVTITITFLGTLNSKVSMGGSFITNYSDLFPDETGTWSATR